MTDTAMMRARPGTKRAGGIFAARTVTGWLRLAAAPTFGLMGLASMLDAGPMATMCSGGGLSLGGMAPMYLLMATFHLGPWFEMLPAREH